MTIPDDFYDRTSAEIKHDQDWLTSDVDRVCSILEIYYNRIEILFISQHKYIFSADYIENAWNAYPRWSTSAASLQIYTYTNQISRWLFTTGYPIHFDYCKMQNIPWFRLKKLKFPCFVRGGPYQIHVKSGFWGHHRIFFVLQ